MKRNLDSPWHRVLFPFLKQHRIILTLMTILACSLTLIETFSLVLLAPITQGLMNQGDTELKIPFFEQNLSWIQLVGLFFVLVLSRAVIQFVLRVKNMNYQLQLITRLRSQLNQRIIENLSSRTVNSWNYYFYDVCDGLAAFLHSLSTIFVSGLLLTSYTFIIIWFLPELLGILGVAGVLFVPATWMIHRRVVEWAESSHDTEEQWSSMFNQHLNGAFVISCLGEPSFWKKRFENMAALYRRSSWRRDFWHFLGTPISEVLGAFILVASILYTWASGIKLSAELAGLIPAGAVLYRALPQLRILQQGLYALSGNWVHVKAWSQLNIHKLNTSPKKAFFRVHLNNVSLAYSGQPHLLKDVYWTLEQGQIIGLTGPNGSGKTTLARLLSGHLEPNEGKLSYQTENGNNLFTPFIPWVAFVSGSDYVFSLSRRDNIALGRKLEQQTLQDVASWLGLGPLEEKISDAQLSRGERQMLTLARILVEPPSLVIFDEFGSHLDADCRPLFIQALHRLKRNSAVLIISHDAPLLQQADRTYLLKNSHLRSCQTQPPEAVASFS